MSILDIEKEDPCNSKANQTSNPSELPILDSKSLIKSPHRFNIMMLLYTFTRMRNKKICTTLKLTPGNVDHHTKTLIKKGWIKERFIFEIRPLKVLEITEEGKEEFRKYITEIKNVLNNIPDID